MSRNTRYFSWLPDFAKEITIVVKNPNLEPTQFVTPKDILTGASRAFLAALWGETRTNTAIDIHGVEPGTYASYLMWVYRKKIAIPSSHDHVDDSQAGLICDDLVKLWILANGLQNEDCQNTVIDNILDLLGKHACLEGSILFSASSTIYIWSATTSGSPLRRIVLDYFLAYVRPDQVIPHIPKYHPDFLGDLTSVTPRSSDLDPLRITTPVEAVRAEHCFYHDHWHEFTRWSCVSGARRSLGAESSRYAKLAVTIDLSKQVTLIINPESLEHAATFTVPELLLTENSQFFRAAFRNNWKEATTRTVELPEVAVSAFHLYLNWVYHKDVITGSRPPADEIALVIRDYVELWLLGDRFADTELRNSTIGALKHILHKVKDDVREWTTAFPLETTDRIWSATTEGRALRRFVVDIFDSEHSTEKIYRFGGDWCPEFLGDLMVRMMRRQRGESNEVWRWNSASHYYEHDERW